ncbi:peptidoglycan-binding protein [Mesorhizobium sp. BAC0120]|uniref:peptidoglycan-binding protein n=1 Tax=Mesorhizobium sp. BAC0120 TaxID=3090670 RepID=UPI00298C12A1|nr:peptidoglycan-binding protein [Mesorhizobium sp. BAC0120]MDW6025298.1 peptidoglycan-binding protein [Mesorhizobium sp. BAC0120]
MNSRRSYLETLNAGRQRRAHSPIEQLNRSLETLEERIGRTPDRWSGERDEAARASLPPIEAGRWEPRSSEASPHARAERTASRFGENEQSSYRTLASDLERLRDQEDSVAAVGRIAGELKGLREELRQQMTTGLRREFDALRKDIARAYSAPAKAVNGAELTAEFDRLSDAIHSLSEKTDDKAIKLLRLELEQVRGALDSLAREDTVRSVDRRWEELGRRFAKFEDRFDARSREDAADPAIAALNDRLEQINQAVNNLPESLSLRSLEEKVRTLAGAVDHFAHQQDSLRSAPLDLIEERLDEISRAIVASAATASAPHFDPQPFERVEARISSLARQIEELIEDRPSVEVIDRLNLLSRRVDEIAAAGRMPEESIERLARQVSIISDKLDRAPAAPDADRIFRGIEQRFDMLSELLDRKQDDAIEHSQTVFRDLERRLEVLSGRLDDRDASPTFDSSGIMHAIDARFEELARRLDTRGSSDRAISGLEARLEDISARLESSAAPVAAVDPGIIHNLEAQVAELSRHLAGPSMAFSEFDDIAPRLDEIEKSLTSTRESIVEAARQAAENAVRSLSGSKTETAAVAALADDLKSLEDLARRSDERNTKTFEAIHDTLLKIVERLGSLEDTTAAATDISRKIALTDAPSIEPDEDMHLAGDPRQLGGERHEMPLPRRSPAEAAAEAAVAALGSDATSEAGTNRVRSMLGGISRAFSKKEQEPAKAEPSLSDFESDAGRFELDQPLDPKIANRPLEPGSGAPDLGAIMRRVRDERGQPQRNSDSDAAKSDFIAAARRAAQAAAAEADMMKRNPELGGAARNVKIGKLFRSKRKPILMATTAILIALAGLQLGKAFFNSDANLASSQRASLAEQPDPDAVTADNLPPAEEMQAPASSALQPYEAQSEAPAAENPVAVEADAIPETPMDSEAGAQAADKGAQTAAVTPGQTDVAQAAAPAAPARAAEASRRPETASRPGDQGAQPVPAAASAEPVPVDAGPVPLREAAEAGDPKAMFEIGSRYADGRGTKQDMKTAAKWYEKAAELGLVPAQYRIGNFYEKGIGVERDIAKAKTWYQMAAEQGNASAMHNLAVLFAMGADGSADNDSAARWFEKAAELGVKDSQFNLGILSAKGVGVPQNLEESYKWFALVAKTGDRDAAAKRDEIANALRPEQLQRARAATELWKAKPVDAETNTVSIPDAWRESDTKTAGIDMKKAVRNIQVILNKNGYDAGSADGVMGAKTKLAIAAFQKANGMEATGEVNETLVRKLLEKK